MEIPKRKTTRSFNTAANAPYRFEVSDDDSLNALHQKIASCVGKPYQEKNFLEVIKSADSATQAKFYAGFKLGTQNFEIERAALNAGSDDDLAAFAKAQPDDFFNSMPYGFYSTVLNRGLIKTLDVLYARTPTAQGIELYPNQHFTKSIFDTLSMCQILHPDMMHYHPDTMHYAVTQQEQLETYLRGFDYLLTKAPDSKTRYQMMISHLEQWVHIMPSLISEFEKRGLNLDTVTKEMAELYFKTGKSGSLRYLEEYNRLKKQGPRSAETNTMFYESVKRGATEDELIAFIKTQEIDITTYINLSGHSVHRGLSRLQEALLQQCAYPKKDQLATAVLGYFSGALRASSDNSPEHIQKVLACLDVLIKNGADTKNWRGNDLILYAALEKNQYYMIPELTKREFSLEASKEEAKRIINDIKYGDEYAPPLSKSNEERIRKYQEFIDYIPPEDKKPTAPQPNPKVC
jgi:hypothetical protein